VIRVVIAFIVLIPPKVAMQMRLSSVPLNLEITPLSIQLPYPRKSLPVCAYGFWLYSHLQFHSAKFSIEVKAYSPADEDAVCINLKVDFTPHRGGLRLW